MGEVLDKVYAFAEGKEIDIKTLTANKELRSTFEQILPEFDQDRVYDNDIKKLYTWYNILINAGYTKFTEEAPAEEETPAEEAYYPIDSYINHDSLISRFNPYKESDFYRTLF